MSAPTEPHTTTLRLPALALGLLLVALGVSGLLDDSGVLPHPPLTIAVAALVAGSLQAIVHTIRQLATSERADRSA